MTNKKQINLRVDEETLERIRKQAEKENRSVNNFIENVIKEYIDKKENGR